MEIGNFFVSVMGHNDSSSSRSVTIFYDLNDKIFYKFMKHNSSNEFLVVHSLTDLRTLSSVDGYPNSHTKYLLDNEYKTYSFELKSFDIQQKINVCILSREYINQDIKDAWVFGLKRGITELETYEVFKTIEEFDYFIKNDFNTYKNLKLTLKINEDALLKSDKTDKVTETINTYDTVKQCVDEVNDYVRSMLNKTTDNKIQLNSYNLLEKAVEFHNTFDNEELNIVETIQEMLASKEYVLSDDFKKNKLDLKDIQFKFKMLTSPETISKDEILAEVFNIDNTVSLI